MQTSKHTESLCTPMQSKLNTIVDNTTIALKSQLNALFADLLVESEEYNETNQILLTLPIVKKLISASAYVAAHTQPEADQVPQLNTMNISQTCTFNYDSLNHITPPIIDEDENEDTPQQEQKEEKESVNEDENKGLDEDEEQVEDEEESIEDSEVQVQEVETTVSVAPSVIDPTAVTNEEAKENICLEIIEPDEPEEEEEDYDEGDEQDEDVEEDDKEDEAVVETKIEEVVEEVDESDEEDVEEVDESDEEDVEEPEEPKVELEEPKVEPPKTEEPLDEEEEESEEEEEQSSEEELVTEEETKEESDEEEGEEEDDGEEVFEIDIFGKTYYTNNATNGDIYLVDESGDPGDEVGKFVNGIATFSKK